MLALLCGFTPGSMAFWNVPTTGHAQVYPSYTNDDLTLQLGFAANDAKDFMYDMARGLDVAHARADANASASKQNEQLTWTTRSDADDQVKFLPPQ